MTASGQLDPTFGASRFYFAGSNVNAGPTAGVLAGGDHSYVGCTCANSTGQAQPICIARVNSTGTLDLSFGSAGISALDFGLQMVAFDVIKQTDGKVLVGGLCQLSSGLQKFCVARVFESDSPDLSFADAGFQMTGDVYLSVPYYGVSRRNVTLVLLGDGSVLSVASCYNEAFNYAPCWAKFSGGGDVDTSISATGIVASTFMGSAFYVRHVQQMSDGSLAITGECATPISPLGREQRACVAKYSLNGMQDTTWAVGNTFMLGVRRLEMIRGMYIASSPDGGIFVGGTCQAHTYPWHDRLCIMKLLSDGSVDITFRDGNTARTKLDFVNGNTMFMTLDLEGRILIGGTCIASVSMGAASEICLDRLQRDGGVDQSFARTVLDTYPAKFLTIGSGYGASIQSNGKIVVCGGGALGLDNLG